MTTYPLITTREAKQIPLVSFLERLGYTPAQTRGHEAWYMSPLRDGERTPSFKVETTRNVWYDFGMGAGGTIIDLMQYLFPSDTIPQLLARIDRADTSGMVIHEVAHHETKILVPSIKPIIESVSDIHAPWLLSYLRSRAIPVELARMYLKEIAYIVGEKHYTALGLPNVAGGYELRNAHFKGVIGNKAISWIDHNSLPTQANIFEGMFDFLSDMVHRGRDTPERASVILNSVGMLDRGIAKIVAAQKSEIYAYLDHDDAGKAATQRLIQAGKTQGFRVSDAGILYPDHADYNDFLRAGRERER